MAQDVDNQQVLRASDTVDQNGDGGNNDPGTVTETRQRDGATPVSQSDSTAAPANSTMSVAERHAVLRQRYGGMYWGSDFLGFAVAIFFTIVFLAIVGAIIGAVGFQLHAPVPKIGGHISGQTQNLGIGALVGSLVAVFLAYFLGGYAAGRMARFSGLANGFGVWLWTIIVAIILSIAGAIIGNRFNLVSQIHLNINRTTLTTAGVISIIVTLAVMLIGALIGGMSGRHFHKQIESDAETLQ